MTLITTGKVATPELVSAMRPIEWTVPTTGAAAPPVVISTWSPALMWPTTLASTLALTISFALTRLMSPVELPESELPDPLPLSLDPLPPEPEPAPALPPDPPLSCWPMVRPPTPVTMPPNGAVSVAPLSAVLALFTWDWAALTDAWSAASWALDALLAWSWESCDWAPARRPRPARPGPSAWGNPCSPAAGL